MADAFSQAMEDGTQTLKSTVIKKEFDRPVFVVAAHLSPSSSSAGEDTHHVYETRLDDGDEGILIDTGAAINCVGENLLRPVRCTDGISWGTTNGESQLRISTHSSLYFRPWERYNKNRHRGMHPMPWPWVRPGTDILKRSILGGSFITSHSWDVQSTIIEWYC